ncbi:MAG: hypothetical protein QXI58_03905 [Candidatus Micrarchaeia archaeon]
MNGKVNKNVNKNEIEKRNEVKKEKMNEVNKPKVEGIMESKKEKEEKKEVEEVVNPWENPRYVYIDGRKVRFRF